MCYVGAMASGDTDNTITTASADYKEAAPSPDASPQRGRPSKRTPELIAKILGDIEAGDSERVAVLANDVPWSTWNGWKAEDPGLSDQCQHARAKGLQQIRAEYRTTDHPVRAKVCHHMLAVKDRDEWAETQKVEHSGNVNVTATLAALFAADAGEVPLDGDAG